MKTLYTDTFETPFGLFSLAVDDAGALAATAFGDGKALRARLGKRQAEIETSPSRTAHARKEVLAYFAGKRAAFEVPCAPEGSPFQQKVWAELQAIPFGQTTSYGELARKLKSAPRAVGRANATNPICLIVPCHRVVGADGSLTGFAFGEDIKRRLLEHEKSRAA